MAILKIMIHQICVPRSQGGGTGGRLGALFVPFSPAAGKQTREEAGPGWGGGVCGWGSRSDSQG